MGPSVGSSKSTKLLNQPVKKEKKKRVWDGEFGIVNNRTIDKFDEYL